jgi:uncharacterized protein
MKYLLLLALFVIVLMFLRQAQGARTRRDASRARPPERMVSCAVCKLNLPVSESLFADGRYYCCAAHRSEAPETHG